MSYSSVVANELMESGQVSGNVVLVAPELVWTGRFPNSRARLDAHK
jgi:hypothetical protein